MVRAAILIIILFYSSASFSCLGMVEGRAEWVQIKAQIGLGFISILFLIGILTTFIKWKGIWKLPLIGYALFTQLQHTFMPTKIVDFSCAILKEEITHLLLALGMIIFVFEVKTVISWIKKRKCNERNT